MNLIIFTTTLFVMSEAWLSNLNISKGVWDELETISDEHRRIVRQFPTIPPTAPLPTVAPTVPPPATIPPVVPAPAAAICVPVGTCSTPAPPPGSVIDPRIVIPGQVVPPAVVNPAPVPLVCPAGQVSCLGTAGATCGRRYVTTPINTADGPATYGAYPWQAFIRNQTGYTGSGVLLDGFHVLTAAHKVNLNQATPGNLQVYIGVWDPLVLTTAQMRTVISMRIHPQFDPNTLRNDIAVIRLNAPIALGYQLNIGTACLPVAGAVFTGQRCAVSGWGRSGFTIPDAPTSPQRQVTVGIVDYQTCRTSLSQPAVLGTQVDTYLDPNGELCAGGEVSRDACTQDGGAPLVCQGATGFTIAGLVIWGKGCGMAGVYGVYVDIGKYVGWINGAVSELSFG